jgi:hypothetical protein
MSPQLKKLFIISQESCMQKLGFFDAMQGTHFEFLNLSRFWINWKNQKPRGTHWSVTQSEQRCRPRREPSDSSGRRLARVGSFAAVVCRPLSHHHAALVPPLLAAIKGAHHRGAPLFLPPPLLCPPRSPL